MKKIAITASSNLLRPDSKTQVDALCRHLESYDIRTVCSPLLFQSSLVPLSGAGALKADILNRFFADDTIDYICDISGGDLSNETLHFLDYDVIRKSRAVFAGYSDLTAILNAIYTKCQKPSILYNIKNFLSDDTVTPGMLFDGNSRLFTPDFQRVYGEMDITCTAMPADVPIVGGNIRCFLKLAGTPYMPDVTGKYIFLESQSGGPERIASYFAQLYQTGILEQTKGILLGTFTELENACRTDIIYEIISQYTDRNTAVYKTDQVGHASTSLAIRIG